jgi:shikimate kinase
MLHSMPIFQTSIPIAWAGAASGGEEGHVALGLIGMSGIGKTAWAERLAAAGHGCLHCDDLIARRLRRRFAIGSPSLADVGAWMGMPHEPHYAERAAAYLAAECAVMRAIAAMLARRPEAGRGLVVDLTGSAVYVDPATLRALRETTTIVYLEADATRQERLLAAYLAQPRPLIWGGAFQPEPGEPPEAAVARSYPRLLARRAALYDRLSHVRVPASVHLDPNLSVADFLHYVEARARAH